LARILFFVFLAFLVWLAVRVLGAKRSRPDAGPPTPTPASPPRAAIEPIAQCAWCGVHVPTGSAIALPDGRVYCGVPHRDAARAARSDAPT
jgi:hypothetical protein